MSEKDNAQPEREDAIEVEAEIIDAEVISEEKPKKRNDTAIFIVIALVVGLVAGPFIQTLLTPYLPAALQPNSGMSSNQNSHQSEVDERLTMLEGQQKNAADQLTSFAQQIRELQVAEASRSVTAPTIEKSVDNKSVENTAFNDQFDALQERLEAEMASGKVAVKRMIADLKADYTRASDRSESVDTSELIARLNMMETNLLKLSGELELALREAQQLAKDAVRPVDGRVTELAEKVDAMAIEAAKRVDAIKRETFAIALVQLRVAIEKGQAFADFLDAFAGRFGGDAMVDRPLEDLQAHGETGIKNINTLKAELRPVISEILTRSGDGETGFWTQTKERLARLVTVRRTGDIAGGDVEAILARAEHSMAKADLAGAVDEVKSLPENDRKIASTWIKDGDAHLSVEAALLRLEQQALLQAGSN